MTDKKTKQSLLSHVIESDEFKNSRTNKKLLTYLVEASINKDELKEYTIAVDVFGKEANFNCNEDPIVRVSIHNLREKLKKYYQKEGKNDKIKIEIPKGHYNVDFVSKNYNIFKSQLFHTRIYLYIIIVLLFSALLYTQLELLSFKNQIGHNKKPNKNNKIWGNILTSQKPKLIVLGDHFFFTDSLYTQNELTIVRKEYINSNSEFEEYKSVSKKRNLQKLKYPLFAMNSVWPLPDIINVLNTAGIPYSMKWASIVNSTDLKTYDIIFIGNFSTLAMLSRIFKNSRYSYELKPQNKLIMHSNNIDSTITYIRQGGPDVDHIDYCLVRKLPGPNNNIILTFNSFHATGITGAVNQFTQMNTIKNLEEVFTDKYKTVPKFFDIIFKSTGYNRNVFSTEIEYIEKIDPETIHW